MKATVPIVGLIAGGVFLWGVSGNASEHPGHDGLKAESVPLAISIESLDGAVQDIQVGNQNVVSLASDMFFSFDSATLSPESAVELQDIAEWVKRKGVDKVRVDGHTDDVGDAAYNQTLSLQRAKAVSSQLSGMLPGVTVTATGHGSTRPVAADEAADGSDDPNGRAKNRRVEITF